MEIFNQKVYGVVGVQAKMANWNADFTGRPKSTSSGEIYGSDKALKYSCRRFWMEKGERVLYFSRRKATKDNGSVYSSLDETYEVVFGEEVKKTKEKKKIVQNLFSAVDVQNFGAAFPVKDFNISLTGAVQVGQGFNAFSNARTDEQDVLSPFRNSNKDEDTSSKTIGKQSHTDEAHYLYPLTVNPHNYKEFVDIGFIDGYTKEAYELLKEGLTKGATTLNSASKMGAFNEFSLFIEMKEGSDKVITSLETLINIEEATDSDKRIFDVSALTEFLLSIEEDIEKIELHYNPRVLDIEGMDGLKADIIDIDTNKVLS